MSVYGQALVSGEVDEALLEIMSLEIGGQGIGYQIQSDISSKVNENSTDELIERTQFYLKFLGLYDGINNGVSDTKLEHAIMRSQNSNRNSVDGS